MNALAEQFGPIDIYLFDQLLRGRISPGMRILDAGRGGGRNLIYLLREHYDIYAADSNAESVAQVADIARVLHPGLVADSQHFRVEPIEAMSFPDGFADVVLCNAVLHFARDTGHFSAIVAGMWRVLAPGGLLFCRLASTIGMESRVRHMEGTDRRYILPDGSTRYLVDETMLMEITGRLGATLLDPLKTTIVQNQRCMTTWVLRK